MELYNERRRLQIHIRKTVLEHVFYSKTKLAIQINFNNKQKIR